MNSGKHQVRRYCARGLAVVWLGTCVGCGSGLVNVKGTVTLDDQPVDNGVIVFEPADRAGPTDGGKLEQGKYRLTGEAKVMPGKKIVRITAMRKTGSKHDASMPGSARKVWVDELEQYIPAVYNDESTLTCEVVAGKANEHNFELKSQ